MRRKIPSTIALTAFESAARHQSFTKAAEELSVTQSAVCRQIAVLEDLLGVEAVPAQQARRHRRRRPARGTRAVSAPVWTKWSATPWS